MPRSSAILCHRFRVDEHCAKSTTPTIIAPTTIATAAPIPIQHCVTIHVIRFLLRLLVASESSAAAIPILLSLDLVLNRLHVVSDLRRSRPDL